MKIINEKDRQILELIAAGNTIKEIAGKVYLSIDSVNKRIKNLKIKNNCKSNPQLIAKAITNGLLCEINS